MTGVTRRVSVRDIESLAPDGSSGAVIVSDDNDNLYVTKFSHNGQGGPRLLVNEFVAAFLAQPLDVPCAPPYILDVDGDAIRRGAAVLKSSPIYEEQLPTAGTAFGSPVVAK